MQDTSKNCGYNNRSVRGERACLLALLSSSALTDHEHCVHRDHDRTSMGQRPRCYCSLQLWSRRQQYTTRHLQSFPRNCARSVESLSKNHLDTPAPIAPCSHETEAARGPVQDFHHFVFALPTNCSSSQRACDRLREALPHLLSRVPSPSSFFKKASEKLSVSVAAACD